MCDQTYVLIVSCWNGVVAVDTVSGTVSSVAGYHVLVPCLGALLVTEF